MYARRANVPDFIVKGGVTYRIISDNLGSPRLVVDTATGAVIQTMDFDEWGNVIADTNPEFQPFGYALDSVLMWDDELLGDIRSVKLSEFMIINPDFSIVERIDPAMKIYRFPTKSGHHRRMRTKMVQLDQNVFFNHC